MTIKKRLFISNTLMIVIPVIISLIISFIFISIAAKLLGIPEIRKSADDDLFYRTIDTLQSLPDHTDLETLLEKTAGAEIQAHKTVSLTVYRAGELVYSAGGSGSGPVSEDIMSQAQNQKYYTYNSFFYTQIFGEYTVYVGTGSIESYGAGSFGYGIAIYASLIMIIFLTNRFLTRSVFKSIVTPLNTLADGVHEIRDGNLDYRIAYQKPDEFMAICDDFNEMAEQLSLLIRGKQRDDENRRELIAGISHDLRTPLTSIKACAEGLIAGVASTPEQQQDYLAAIVNKTDDLAHIVSQLFLFSKLDTGEFPFLCETVDIGAQLSGYVAGIAAEYQRRGLLITLTEYTKGVCIEADMVQLRSVFTNVFENALRYGRKDQKEITITCKREQADVVISMTDNGPGVPEESINRLFSPFYRDDKARTNKGSGLGLAISAKIIESFGGSVSAANHSGGGLRIVISLPVRQGGRNETNTDH